MRPGTVATSLAAVAVCVTGCTAPASPREPAAAPAPTGLATYDTVGVRVERAPFCDRVSPTAVEHVLGGPPRRSREWRNGDRVPLPDGSRDRVHEYGCSWTAGDGTVARAWVFVPPVTPGRARRLAREAAPGCRVERPAGFGRPSVSTRCTSGGETEATYRGLFGDGWLTCAVTSPGGPGDLAGTVGPWCVAVLEAARS